MNKPNIQTTKQVVPMLYAIPLRKWFAITAGRR